MDQAVAALLGAAIATVGAIGATAVSGLWQGRQVRSAAMLQHAHWRAQGRRETYSRFLATASQAREELSALLRVMLDDHVRNDRDDVERRIDEARTLVYAVQQARADVALEGPPEVLESSNRTEEDIAHLFAGLRALHAHLPTDDRKAIDAYVQRCARQRMRVRKSIVAFAHTARAVLDGPDTAAHEESLSRSGSPANPTDLAWLVTRIAGFLHVPHDRIDRQMSPLELGLDSLAYLSLGREVERRYGIPDSEVWYWNDLSLDEIAERLSEASLESLTAQRQDHLLTL